MKAHQEMFGVRQMCQVLGVSRSGYYAWRRRQPSRRSEANTVLPAEIPDKRRKKGKRHPLVEMLALAAEAVVMDARRLAASYSYVLAPSLLRSPAP